MLFDEEMMLLALEEAKKAAAAGEVPVGAIVVDENGAVIGRGHNVREEQQRPTGHAEIIAIEQAAQLRKNWRLSDCTLYVTLEPCPMCAGASVQSRIEKVFFGAYYYKAGCAGSKINLFQSGMFNHDAEVVGGVMEKECAGLLTEFFKELRKKKRRDKDEI